MRALGRESGVIVLAVGARPFEIGGAGEAPVPLLPIPVEDCAGMDAVGRRFAPRLGRQLPRHVAERSADVMLGLGIDRRFDIAGQVAIDSRPAPKPQFRWNGDTAGARGARALLLGEIALGGIQNVVAAGVQVDGRPTGTIDLHPGRIAVAAIEATYRRVSRDLRRGRAEIRLKHDIHDSLVGAIAIFERDLLGQDVDPLDRLDRDVAKLAVAGDTPAVEKDERFRAGVAGASDLGADRFQQLVEIGRAGGANVARAHHIVRGNVADDGTARRFAGDDNFLFVRRIRLGSGRSCHLEAGRSRRRRLGRGGCDRHDQAAPTTSDRRGLQAIGAGRGRGRLTARWRPH